jgi:hypothetical protein
MRPVVRGTVGDRARLAEKGDQRIQRIPADTAPARSDAPPSTIEKSGSPSG